MTPRKKSSALAATPDPWPVAAALVTAAYALTLAHPIDLVTADLGRHLKNGELFFKTLRPITTNLYSYTQPELPVVNHHWGAGTAFYAIWNAGGFTGLHAFFIALCAATLLLVFGEARRAAGTGAAALAALFAVPLLAERSEIRPEAFTYFLSAAFFCVLSGTAEGRLSRRWLWLLPPLCALWVNAHIYFILGPALIFIFYLRARLGAKRDFELEAALSGAFFFGVAACLLNPAGSKGLLSPATIFRHYGYRVAENQSVWFMERLGAHPRFLLLRTWCAALAAGFAGRWLLARARTDAADALLAAGLGVLAWLAIRNVALFAFFAPLILCRTLGAAFEEALARRRAALSALGVFIAALWVACAASGRAPAGLHVTYPLGLGALPGNSAGADFLRREGVRGPIFNDYDIGGYLILHLFPEERVFVDNRPEAYTESFLKDVYIPMQERDDVWTKQDRRWKFNAIVFNLRDQTPWGQAFLIRRVQDPSWAPVFAEGSVIVFVRRDPRNAAVISRNEIARDRFTIKRN